MYVHHLFAYLLTGEFPYAKCYVCGERGHLSRMCPHNPRGLYVDGGCCNQCGSVEHYKRDCPEFLKQKGMLVLQFTLIISNTDIWAQLFKTNNIVNISLNFQTYISEISQYFLLKKCENLLPCKSFSLFFNKNISVFDYRVIKHLTS